MLITDYHRKCNLVFEYATFCYAILAVSLTISIGFGFFMQLLSRQVLLAALQRNQLWNVRVSLFFLLPLPLLV
jgi:hypothetical protein